MMAIACIQHGFDIYDSLTSPDFKVNGTQVYEAINKYLSDPINPPWLIDEGEWPDANKGCNGLSTP